MTSPTVATVLPTYNGSAFLLEQLESIARQSRLPDELIVRDDASTDQTLDIAAKFAAAAPFPVRVHQNRTNIGLAENLRALVAECSADVVFFCDQDDIWLPYKIEQTLAEFTSGVDAVLGDSRPFDSVTGKLGPRTVWETIHGGLPDPDLRALARRNFAAGHNLAVRRSALATASWPAGVWVDCWIGMVFAARGSLALVPEPMVLYRQHGSNRIGLGGRSVSESRAGTWLGLAETLEAVRTFLGREGTEIPPDVDGMLLRRVGFLRDRVSYLERPLRHLLTPARLALAGDYAAFANGWQSLAADLATPLSRMVARTCPGPSE